MKPTIITCVLAGAMCLTIPAFGQDDRSRTKKPDATAAPQDAFTRLVDSEKITGSDVWDYHGNKIGSIKRVLLEPFGRNVFLVIEADELLEDDRPVVVPWKKFQVKMKKGETDTCIFALDADKAKLKGAPALEGDLEAALFDDARSRMVHQYWGVEVETKRDHDRGLRQNPLPGRGIQPPSPRGDDDPLEQDR